jgi:hypothetical protein
MGHWSQSVFPSPQATPTASPQQQSMRDSLKSILLRHRWVPLNETLDKNDLQIIFITDFLLYLVLMKYSSFLGVHLSRPFDPVKTRGFFNLMVKSPFLFNAIISSFFSNWQIHPY